MGTLTIGKPEVSSADGWTRLSVPVSLGEKHSNLWVQVEDQYAHGLCADRVDGFVVGVLSYAIKNRLDIAFEAPITNLLKEQLERDFIDVVCQQEPQLYPVQLTGETIAPIYKQKVVRAMGLSCGVDCLYTVHHRMLNAEGERYFVMSDAHQRSRKDTVESAANRFQPLYENGREFSAKLGIPLIVVRTNWGEDALPGLDIDNNTTYCNCFVALVLQNLFTHYYLASGGPVQDFGIRYLKLGLLNTDSSDYDLLSLSAYSIPAIRFIVDGLAERVAKIRDLLSWPVCWNNLDVCLKHYRHQRGNDTCDCHKCMHTVCAIMSQEGMEGLEKFSKVFDVDYVRAHRAEYLAYTICQRVERSEIGLEIWKGRTREGCTVWDYIHAMYIIVRKQIRKFIRNKPAPRSWADI